MWWKSQGGFWYPYIADSAHIYEIIFNKSSTVDLAVLICINTGNQKNVCSLLNSFTLHFCKRQNWKGHVLDCWIEGEVFTHTHRNTNTTRMIGCSQGLSASPEIFAAVSNPSVLINLGMMWFKLEKSLLVAFWEFSFNKLHYIPTCSLSLLNCCNTIISSF